MPVKVAIKIIPKCIKALRKVFPEIEPLITCGDKGNFEYISIPVDKFSSSTVSAKMLLVARLLSTTVAHSVTSERYLYDKQYIIVTKFLDSTVISLSGGYSV